MADYYVKSGQATQFAISTAYSSGQKIVPARADAGSNSGRAKQWVWECTTPGTSAGANPTWPGSVTQDVTTVTSSGATFTARKPGYSSGSTANWAFATPFLDYLLDGISFTPVIVHGDRIFVSNNHSDTSSSPSFYTLNPNSSTPNNRSSLGLSVLCVDDSAAPPTALATGAVVNGTTFADGGYVYGTTFRAGGMLFAERRAQEHEVFDTCTFVCTSAVQNFWQGNASANVQHGTVDLINCTFDGNSGAGTAVCELRPSTFDLRISGGTVVNWPSTGANCFIDPSAGGNTTGGLVLVEGLDMSGLPSTHDIFGAPAQTQVFVGVLRNCKLPASWSGLLVQTGVTDIAGRRAEMYNCDSGSTNYRLYIDDYHGTIKDETTLVRTGGASDGTTGLSWKMVTRNSSVRLGFPAERLRSPEIVRWNETVGSPITVTVDVLHDSATNLKNDEIWIEAQYLGDSGSPQSTILTDAKAGPVATAADQDASSATWTTSGLSNPNKQKVAVTFTPQRKGFIHATVHVAKSNYTVYVDPVAQVS